MRTLYIGVNYNSSQYAIEWARKINSLKDDKDILIVDNSMDADPNLKKTILKMSNICYYIKTPYNLGYINGAAYGLKNFGAQVTRYDWIVLSNVDIVIMNSSIDDILKEYNTDDTVGIIAPSIINKVSGADINPYMEHEIKKNKLKFLRFVTSSSLLFSLYSFASTAKERRAKPTLAKKESCKIFAPHGSVIYFSRVFFERGNSLECPIFLYCEEIYVGLLCKNNGLSVIYEPRIQYENIGHVTTSLIKKKTNTKYFNDSLRFVFNLDS